VTPRTAATVILMRGGAGRLELLMVRRTPRARFMAGHWVFPGGAVDAADGTGQAGLRAAARRELAEEAGIELPTDCELVPFARWITPEESPIRFDTWFFLAVAPVGVAAVVDGVEIVDFRWVEPAGALAEAAAGGLQLAFPTERQLRQLSAFESAEAALEHARQGAGQIRPIQPVIVGSGSDARIVLPEELAGDGDTEPSHVQHRVDQRQVREGLRVVAEVAAAAGVELLGIEPER
jgi:8-oxo-dGTP pyrophosphatase MutT (NUDIX family)